MKTLVGMFITFDEGGKCLSGELVEQITPYQYLVQFDSAGGGSPYPLELMSTAQMIERSPEGLARCQFFETRAAMEAWMNYIFQEGGDVLRLVTKSRRKED